MSIKLAWVDKLLKRFDQYNKKVQDEIKVVLEMVASSTNDGAL